MRKRAAGHSPVAKSEKKGIATGTIVSSRVIHFPARGCRCLCGKSRHAHAHAIPQIKFAGCVPGVRFGRSLSAVKDSGEFLLGNGPRVRVTWPTSAICKLLNICKLLHTFCTGTWPPSPQTPPRRRLSQGAAPSRSHRVPPVGLGARRSRQKLLFAATQLVQLQRQFVAQTGPVAPA